MPIRWLAMLARRPSPKPTVNVLQVLATRQTDRVCQQASPSTIFHHTMFILLKVFVLKFNKCSNSTRLCYIINTISNSSNDASFISISFVYATKLICGAIIRRYHHHHHHHQVDSDPHLRLNKTGKAPAEMEVDAHFRTPEDQDDKYRAGRALLWLRPAINCVENRCRSSRLCPCHAGCGEMRKPTTRHLKTYQNLKRGRGLDS